MYCLTNITEDNESGSLYRGSQGGLIQVYKPRFIGHYNDNMGVVDLSDMRRLYCNSTIMGLK